MYLKCFMFSTQHTREYFPLCILNELCHGLRIGQTLAEKRGLEGRFKERRWSDKIKKNLPPLKETMLLSSIAGPVAAWSCKDKMIHC